MIIQCKQCRTKFRFDDAQIVDDGIWLRCSRCGHVFFQDSPLKLAKGGSGATAFASSDADLKNATGRLTFEPAGALSDKNSDNQEMTGFSKEADVNRESINFADIEFTQEENKPDQSAESLSVAGQDAGLKKSNKNKVLIFTLWALLVIVALPALVYYYIFPKQGELYLRMGERGIGVALEAMGVSQAMQPQSVTGLIKLQDVRQRIINNYILGNIRVVEGFTVNTADFSVANILLKGTILDAYDVVLGERFVYAGNLLSDEELANFSDEEIAQKLAMPSGMDNINEKLTPNGRIPFMIVFVNNPRAIKTTVKIINVERLL